MSVKSYYLCRNCKHPGVAIWEQVVYHPILQENVRGIPKRMWEALVKIGAPLRYACYECGAEVFPYGEETE